MIFDLPGRIRNLLPGNIDALRGPYDTKEAACLAIPNVEVEGRNFREGKIVEIGSPGDESTHRWVGGFDDENLEPENLDLSRFAMNINSAKKI